MTSRMSSTDCRCTVLWITGPCLWTNVAQSTPVHRTASNTGRLSTSVSTATMPVNAGVQASYPQTSTDAMTTDANSN